MSRSDGRSLQQVVEESTYGRQALSGFIALTVGSIVVWNLPSSALKDAVQPLVRPYMETAGLTQSWRIFSPNLRRTNLEVYAVVGYADGSDVVWRPPGDPFLGAYRSERWRKLMDDLRQDDSAEKWHPAASYIAGLHGVDGQSPASVTLVRRWAPIPEPGSDEEPEWNEASFYTVQLDPDTGQVVDP